MDKTAHYAKPDWTAVDRVLEAGRLANLPVMVDYGQVEPGRPLEEFYLKKMRPGDIYMHLYRKFDPTIDENGKVRRRPLGTHRFQRAVVAKRIFGRNIRLAKLRTLEAMRTQVWLIVLLVVLVISARGQTRELIRYEDSRVSMACAYSIVAYGNDAPALRQAVDAAFDEVDRIDRLMSHYKPESPLSRLNREAAKAPVKTDPELFGFLAECLRYSRESDGAFDITVGPLMKAWGFFRGEGRMPSERELAKARRNVGFQHVILDEKERTVFFDQPGVELDLGGIAKGYAVDRAVAVLKQSGLKSALVSAGGSTIYGLGTPPNETGWEVKLQDPIAPDKTALTVRLKDQALSVSGSYEKFFELGGRRYSHILDPRTGRPVEGVLSVAVVTGSGTAGDALDNVFYVQSIQQTRKYLMNAPETEVFFFLPKPGEKWEKIHLKNL